MRLSGTQVSECVVNGQQRNSTVPIADHELIRVIGRGAYGEVWMARHSRLGTLRAIKIVHRQQFTDAHPFEREFEGIRRYEPISRDHPNLIPILHVGGTDEWLYYVMELADAEEGLHLEEACLREIRPPDGRIGPFSEQQRGSTASNASTPYVPHTLRSELKRQGALPIERCIEIGHALASALAHLHRHGLVHRDVKPSNIIFADKVPKLADIGLVAAVDESRSFVGTQGYIPPEGPGAPSADCYGLGKVLYEMSTGRDRQDFPKLPFNLRQMGVPRQFLEFNEIVLKACSHNPDRRYASGHELCHELALLQQGKSVRRKHVREFMLSCAKPAMLVIGLLAVAMAIILSIPIWLHRPPEPKPSPSEAANDAYANGLGYLHKGSDSAMAQAFTNLEKAISIDRKFARAYATLAHAYVWDGPYDPAKLAQARTNALKALSLDPTLDEAHRQLAWTKALLDRDWAGAEKEYKYIIKFNPWSEENLYAFANFRIIQGKTNEALRLARKARDSRSPIYVQNAGWIFLATHQYDRAIQKFEAVIGDKPSPMPRAARLLAAACRETGDYRRAIQLDREVDLVNAKDPAAVNAKYDTLTEAYDEGGKLGYWQQLLELSKGETNTPVKLAALYARIGRTAEAFQCLQLAYTNTPTQLVFQINREPAFDTLRNEPAFAALLSSLGIPK